MFCLEPLYTPQYSHGGCLLTCSSGSLFALHLMHPMQRPASHAQTCTPCTTCADLHPGNMLVRMVDGRGRPVVDDGEGHATADQVGYDSAKEELLNTGHDSRADGS